MVLSRTDFLLQVIDELPWSQILTGDDVQTELDGLSPSLHISKKGPTTGPELRGFLFPGTLITDCKDLVYFYGKYLIATFSLQKYYIIIFSINQLFYINLIYFNNDKIILNAAYNIE